MIGESIPCANKSPVRDRGRFRLNLQSSMKMRIDPAQRIKVEIPDLHNHINGLKNECEKYFRLIEEVRSSRDGWKQGRPMSRYGNKF